MRFLHSFLDTYGLPHRVPAIVRIVALMLAVPGSALILWLLLPHVPVVVALLGIYVLIAIVAGLWRIFSSRELGSAPYRNPQPPPSTTPPSTS